MLWEAYRGSSAAVVLKLLGFYEPPVDVDRVASTLGVEVEYVYDPGWDGALRSSESSAKIWINAEHSRPRRRFTLAHELGHLLLHPLGKMYRDVARQPSSPLEAQANRFAADLLMPKKWVEKYADMAILSPKGSTELLAHIFEVSREAMEIRLSEVYVPEPA